MLKTIIRVAVVTIASKLINSAYKKISSVEISKVFQKKTPVDILFEEINKSNFVDIQDISYSITGNINTEKEKFLYIEVIDSEDIKERIFNLSTSDDLLILQKAKFYKDK